MFFEQRMQFLQFRISPSGIIMSQEILTFVKNTLHLQCHGKSLKAVHLLPIFPFYSLYFNAFSISYVKLISFYVSWMMTASDLSTYLRMRLRFCSKCVELNPKQSFESFITLEQESTPIICYKYWHFLRPFVSSIWATTSYIFCKNNSD